MTIINAFPLATYPAGTRVLPATAIPDALQRVTFSFDNSAWPLTTRTITLVGDYSADGGATWQIGYFGAVVNGGPTRSGGPVTASWTFPPDTNRQVRGSITLNANITTALQLIVE